jgi:hypothetical protein
MNSGSHPGGACDILIESLMRETFPLSPEMALQLGQVASASSTSKQSDQSHSKARDLTLFDTFGEPPGGPTRGILAATEEEGVVLLDPLELHHTASTIALEAWRESKISSLLARGEGTGRMTAHEATEFSAGVLQSKWRTRWITKSGGD